MKTKKIIGKTGTCYQATGIVKSGSMNRITTCGEPALWDYFDGSNNWAMPLCDNCYQKRMGVVK
jgi:hypothetical protein